MGYTIMYDRRFISLGDGRYLPITLSGSSNCTMFVGGKEILDRSWGLSFFGLNDIKTETEMIEWAEHSLSKWKADFEMEWFKQGGKWLVGTDIVSWLKNGCKNAYTVEEYAAAFHPVQCNIHIHNNDTRKWRNENNVYCRTTKELLDFIDIFNNTVVGEKEEKYANISFGGYKPLKMPSKVDGKDMTDYLVKCGKRFVKEYGESFVSWTMNRAEAQVFHGKEEWDKIVSALHRFDETPKMVVASSNYKPKEKNYRIAIVGGLYDGNFIKRLSSASLFFTGSENYSMKFESESAAQRYVDKLKNRDFQNINAYKIVCVA